MIIDIACNFIGLAIGSVLNKYIHDLTWNKVFENWTWAACGASTAWIAIYIGRT